MSDYQGLVTKWQKVQDEMPEYDTDLLLWSEAWGHIYVGYWRHSEEWIGRHRPESDESLPDTNPTHWTYFPAPPLAEVIARNVQPSPDDEELRLDGIMASTPSGALDVIAPTYGGISRSNWPARPVQQPAPAQNASRCESCGQPCALGSAGVQQPATDAGQSPTSEPKPRRMMRVPKNPAYPNFNELHFEDAWCVKSRCTYVGDFPPETRPASEARPVQPSPDEEEIVKYLERKQEWANQSLSRPYNGDYDGGYFNGIRNLCMEMLARYREGMLAPPEDAAINTLKGWGWTSPRNRNPTSTGTSWGNATIIPEKEFRAMTTKLNPEKPDGGETPAICPTCQSSDPIRRGQLHWNLIPSGWCRDAWHAPSPQPSAEATHLQITPELVKALSMETQFPGGVIMEPAPSGETRGTCPHSAISHSFEFCREHHFILERMWKPLAPEAAKKVDWRQEAPIIHAQFVNGKWPLFGTEDIRFLALGIAGEAGEIANDVKKEWRGDPPNRVNLKKELADVRIYLELLAIALDCNLDETCREKLEEVKQRLSAAPEATTKEPEFHVIGMDFAKPDGDRTGYRCSTCGVTTEPCRHLQLLIAKGEVAPGEAVGRPSEDDPTCKPHGLSLRYCLVCWDAALGIEGKDHRLMASQCIAALESALFGVRRERDQLKQHLAEPALKAEVLADVCPDCGSTMWWMRGCSHQDHGKKVHALVRYECIRCANSWHLVAEELPKFVQAGESLVTCKGQSVPHIRTKECKEPAVSPDAFEFYDKIYHPRTGKPPATWEFAEAYAQHCGELAIADRDAARDRVIKLEGRYQDMLKKLDELQAKIEMLTTPDPDFDGERGFYEGI